MHLVLLFVFVFISEVFEVCAKEKKTSEAKILVNGKKILREKRLLIIFIILVETLKTLIVILSDMFRCRTRK